MAELISTADPYLAEPDGNSSIEVSRVKFESVKEFELDKTKSVSTLKELQDPASNNSHIADKQQSPVQKTLSSSPSAQLQERRMSAFAFEPVSLPASRTTSKEDFLHDQTRRKTHSSGGRASPSVRAPSTMHSPPITPAATNSREALVNRTTTNGAPAVTTQISPPATSPSTTNLDESRPNSPNEVAHKPMRGSVDVTQDSTNYRSAFSTGPGTQDSSTSSSRATSPSRTSIAERGSIYSKPCTPSGEPDNPYAAHKRPPQPKNLDSIDSRFKFTAVGFKHRSSPSASSITLPRSSRTNEFNKPEKRHSFLGAHKDKEKEFNTQINEDGAASLNHKHGSMSELKRFLKIGHKTKRTTSPTPSTKSNKPSKTPISHKTPQQLPFGDDHGISSKYGKFGKVLGAGAGGSVRLMKRSSDGTTFAVKEFRTRHSYETEKEYAKKVTAEFCVGSTLHHGNIIETLDIIHEKGNWYEVMEFAPYDLFAIVMTGNMSREEVTCSFLQILSGVSYLHSIGLAHRDLKLDNVVVNDYGIMKIIDFGSAAVFKYPFEDGTTLSSGIVGSDPYLAPEVYDDRKYDPQPADIWSLAIIYCCMSLRRFPWKMPKVSDNSYKLFASAPSPGFDMTNPAEHAVDYQPTDAVTTIGKGVQNVSQPEGVSEKKSEVIKGPWRLLRLLPRESRHIIGRMLELDPNKRATLSEVLDDTWVVNTIICQQESSGKVIKAEGHTHTLEPPSAQPPAK